MRMNVYAEEISGETELVTKTVTDAEFGERTFYGVRMFLHSPEQLHYSPDDDDRSAITVWIPWTQAGGHEFDTIETLLHDMVRRLDEAREADEDAAQGVGIE